LTRSQGENEKKTRVFVIFLPLPASQNVNALSTPEEANGMGLQCSMEKLLSMLETASEYIGKVVDGEVEADDAIGRQIADTLSSVPRIRPEMFDKMFNDSLQDLLMVTYLSNITRTQLTISEKLNASLDVNLK